MAALHALFQRPGHVVAEVVKPELVVRPVGDVRFVGDLALRGRHLRQDDPDLEAEETVHTAHPLRVAPGQVVVGRDDMHALAGDRVEVGREDAGQGLALTGAHLRDVALVERAGAHELDIEGTLAQGAPGRLADGGERLGEQVVERLPVRVPLPELIRHRPELAVAHGLEVVLNRVDLLGDPLKLTQDLALAGAEDAV